MSVGAASSTGRIMASPYARRLAKEAGFDLASLKGSGPQGRIVARDVEAARAGGMPPTPVPAARPEPLATLDASRAYFAPGSYEEIPHDSMRRAIARRMTEAAQSIPHYYLTCDCAIDALIAVRAGLNARAPGATEGEPEWKVSLNDLIVKALALALQDVPEARATFAPDALLRHKSSDIGVAVALPDGLITPIVRDAEKKSARAISEEIKQLAVRAKERKLKPMEYEGGVSAVSNLGMFGVKQFTAVINPPQSSILAVGAGEPRVVARDGKAVVATAMTVTLSCDHRVIDGALGAQLLAAFKRHIEEPAALAAA